MSDGLYFSISDALGYAQDCFIIVSYEIITHRSGPFNRLCLWTLSWGHLQLFL